MKNFLIIITMMFIIGSANSQNNMPQNGKRASKIEAQRVAFITKTLDLTPEESQNFWPLYNEYTVKAKQLRDEQKANKPRKEMSEDEAANAIDFFFKNEQKKLTLKKNYYDKFMMILPSTKVVRLHFAENRFKRNLLKRLKTKKDRKDRKKFR